MGKFSKLVNKTSKKVDKEIKTSEDKAVKKFNERDKKFIAKTDKEFKKGMEKL